MSTQAALARAQQFVAELNSGKLESIPLYLSPEFFAYAPKGEEPTQVQVYADLLSDLREAFPDFQIELFDLRWEDGLLRGQAVLKGTNSGPIWGAPATGKSLQWDIEIALRQIQDRFAISLENVKLPELMAVLRQINLVPPADKMDMPPKYPVVMPDIILKAVFTGQIGDKPCSHLDEIQVIEPSTDSCQQCLASGDIWPALRMCLTCGFVGCCDTSKNKHAKAHFEKTGHPLIRSIRLDESWVWCYEDNAFFEGRLLDHYK